MYPDFRYVVHALFGIEHPWEWLSLFKTFGFFVALSFLGAALTLVQELKRKERQGIFLPEFSTYTVGNPPSVKEILLGAVTGFIIGYKAGGLFMSAQDAGRDPMAYMFSAQGYLPIGLALAGLFAWMRYRELKKQELPEPKQVRAEVYPHQRIGEFVFVALIGGLIGAKLFNALENPADFVAHPIDSLISSSGLTFYGGLITATVFFYFFCRRHNLNFIRFCDATAPGLMLAYGVGRFGCQFSGDGDWGIFNSAYTTGAAGLLERGSDAAFQQAMVRTPGYFSRNFGSLAGVPRLHAPAPSWLPDWLYAMNYPHNVNNEGMRLAGCTGDYCSVLPAGVFPTPLYEAVICIGLFGLLWAFRKQIVRPFHMFGWYLIANGLERFFVEKIRVNYKYDFGFIHPTQAEIISFCMVLAGAGIVLFYRQPSVKAQLDEPV